MYKRQSEPSVLPLDDTKPYPFLLQVNRKLAVYGSERHGNRRNPLEELVFIILSAQTESYLYLQTFKELRRRFPTWSSMSAAKEGEIEAVIRRGGLAKKKATHLKRAMEKITSDAGRLTLAFLRTLSDNEARAYLTTLPGIGIKSASCIMLYSLNRSVFPVDTHVWRVCRRLGLTPQVAKPSPRQELQLEAKVPRSIRYSLHVNLISHGRKTCTTYWPRCDKCVLASICPSRGISDQVWAKFRRPAGVWARAVG